jgi:nucleoside phosphorylase
LLYVVVALKSEAQAFVDAYKLTKSKLGNFTYFSNHEMRLIISGLGVTNARDATQTLINHFDIVDEDKYLNIGICAASSHYKIGDTLEIGSIVYEDIVYSFDTIKQEITCLDEAADEEKYEIVDMESYGFYDAVIHNPAIKNFSILKVVSDHFEPHKVTKDATKALIFNAIKDIF